MEYSLTVKGEALFPLIEDMRRYGSEWLGVRDCTAGAAAAGAGRRRGVARRRLVQVPAERALHEAAAAERPQRRA